MDFKSVIEHPILFNPEMSESILAGRKTQTRRVVKPQPCIKPGLSTGQINGYWRNGMLPVRCPQGAPGHILWVKETHYLYGQWLFDGTDKNGRKRHHFEDLDCGVAFTDDPPKIIQNGNRGKVGWHRRPSMFMPRKYCRTRLRILGIRLERLQDISEDDAKAEGAPELSGHPVYYQHGDRTYREWFHGLWNSINGDSFPWKANPLVWRIEFERM